MVGRGRTRRQSDRRLSRVVDLASQSYNCRVVEHNDHRAAATARLLIVLPSWVGDVVMATPTLRALRSHLADAQITFVGRPLAAELLAGTGWADEFVAWEPKSRRDRRYALGKVAAQLYRSPIDRAILLTNSFRSALLAVMAGAKRRIGYDRDARGLLLTDRLPVPTENGVRVPVRMVDYYGRLAEHAGCPPPGDRLELANDPADEAAIEQRLATLGLGDRRPLVVIAPGASYGSSKLWPIERFAALADRLIETDQAAVVISCGPGEEPLAEKIAASMAQPPTLLIDPVTTLGQFKALIRRCDLLINNDTGPRHIAKAFGRPVVTIFGPTHQGWTDTDYPQERKVAVPVDCGPCQKKICPLDHRCMTGVTVEMVHAAAAELLRAETNQPTNAHSRSTVP